MRGQTWRACAAFGVALLIGACSQTPAALPSAPTGTPSPTPSVAATVTPSSSSAALVYTSTRYRYSITLPIGWVAIPATETWLGTGAPTSEAPVVDLFGPPGGSTASGRAALASSAPTKSLLAAWVNDGIEIGAEIHGDTCPQTPNKVESVTIGGQPGTLEELNCGLLIYTAFTVVNGYGYRFGFRDPSVQAATNPADHKTFTTMLASVVFH